MMPRRRLCLLFSLALVPLAAAPLLGFFWDVPVVLLDGLVGGAALLNVAVWLCALADRLMSPGLRRLRVEREVSEVMSVGAENRVTLWVTHRGSRPLDIELHDEPPAPCQTTGLPFRLHLSPEIARYGVYHVCPRQRGPNQFGSVYMRSNTRWGLWTLTHEIPLPQPVRVYPDIQAVRGMELLARRNRSAELGLRLSRLRGRGTEFDRLREYRREDEYRHIDWKATARHRQLVSREYVVERNQNVVLILDCGRSMRNESAGISHLDRALNAALILSYVALRQGDYVGCLALSNRVHRSLRLQRGVGSIQGIIRQMYDLQADYEATDYRLMVQEVQRRFRKRSLVLLITYALDELHLGAIARHLRELKRPHLVLGAFVRNVPLHQRLNALPENEVEAFQVAAAAQMVGAQTLRIAELQHQGLLVLDVLPEQLSTSLISSYLDVKARHLL